MTCIIINNFDEFLSKCSKINLHKVMEQELPFEETIIGFSYKFDDPCIYVKLNKQINKWFSSTCFLSNKIPNVIPNIRVLNNQWARGKCLNRFITENDDQLAGQMSIAALYAVWIINNQDTHYVKPYKHFIKRFKKEHPQLIGETDKIFILNNNRYKSDRKHGSLRRVRFHLRRGHYAKYNTKEGVITHWIKPMWVGDEDLGKINKTYKL